ncbi:hypothetical protein Btru_031666 [Bulinus truncatus]|nr:hypothetical protein Btru_031666 [Bulinus truncatus]
MHTQKKKNLIKAQSYPPGVHSDKMLPAMLNRTGSKNGKSSSGRQPENVAFKGKRENLENSSAEDLPRNYIHRMKPSTIQNLVFPKFVV